MPRTIALSIGGIFFALSTGRGVLAQTPEDWRKTEEEPVAPKLIIEQSYHGVVPGSGNNLPRIEDIKKRTGQWITWPGFVMFPDGASRLFIQTTTPLLYQRIDGKKSIVLRLKDAKVHLYNNRNPLVTWHFNTPLARAYIKKRRGAVDLVMEMKMDISPAISQSAGEDGFNYLFVDFPKGAYPVSGPESARPAPSDPAFGERSGDRGIAATDGGDRAGQDGSGASTASP